MKLTNDILFKSITHNMADGVYAVDKDMRIVFLNARAREIMGISLEDNAMIGMFCHDFSKGILCDNTASVCETLRTGNEYDNIELKIPDTNGKYKFFRQSTHNIYDMQGEVIGVVALLRDCTEIVCIKSRLKIKDSFQGIIGKNYQMLDLYESISQVAKTNASVLIMGSSGTGKELVADAIHKLSKRKDGPLIKVNCSALSENILESELFGHVKGSFTGAIRDKLGKFELADGGTIFLDEIGELDPKIQIKLLRVLQEKEIEKVGGTKTIKIDVRIIAATNANLKERVNSKIFREDLYYRLNVYPIQVVSLKDRLDDIVLLSKNFLDKYAALNSRLGLEFAKEVIELFKGYSWPGNIRELMHVIEYSVIRAKDTVIKISDLPPDLQDGKVLAVLESSNGERFGLDFEADLNEKTLRDSLIHSGWSKSKAAKELNIGRTTLWRLMKKYHIADPSKSYPVKS